MRPHVALLVLILLLGGCTFSRSADSWTGYRDDPRYTVGLPFETTSPSGQRIYVPQSQWRASQAAGLYRGHGKGGGKH